MVFDDANLSIFPLYKGIYLFLKEDTLSISDDYKKWLLYDLSQLLTIFVSICE